MKVYRVFSSWAVLAGMVVMVMSSRCGAQPTAVGTAFTYQGELKQGGALADSVFDLRFILFNTEVGGAQVGPIVTLEDVPVSGGRFTAELDFGAGVFGAEARWLEIGVRPGSETGTFTPLAPRQRMTPAPVAIHAASAGVADLLDGLDSLSFAAAAHAHDGAEINAGQVGEAFIDGAIARDVEVLGLVLSGDGAGSGLDADLLDGMDSADFAPSVHDHDARYFTETELMTSGGGGQVHYDNLLGVPPMVGDFHSLDASDGDPVDAVFVDAEGNTGFGTTAPTAGLHAAKAGPPGFVDPQPLAEVFDGDRSAGSTAPSRSSSRGRRPTSPPSNNSRRATDGAISSVLSFHLSSFSR